MSTEPYITKHVTLRMYNPEYGDSRICICGHTYERHFDSYEDMEPIGCKYCNCFEFVERLTPKDNEEVALTKNEALKLAVKMHRDFNALDTDFTLEFELCEHVWCRFGGHTSLVYNSDDNEEDMLDQVGNTYSLDIRRVAYEDDDFYKIYADDGCGEKYYMIFLKEKEIFE